MTEPITFLMGKHAAELRADRRYCRNHMWCLPVDSRLRFGFSSYAIRLMQDVYFLEWTFDAPRSVALKEEIGFLESSKAQSALYAPLAGRIECFNQALLSDPSAINVDGYGDGWLFEMTAEPIATMDVTEYHAYLTANWEVTQRIIKKQVLE
ncbi:MAG: glycine cleavage system protein H [Gemmataceae bacterium]